MRTMNWVYLALVVPAVGWGDAGEVASRLDQLYAARHEPQKLKELEKATEAALQAHPEDFGILWRGSRFYYWQCDGTLPKEPKKALGARSAELGQKALEKRPDRVEGHFHAAIGLGCYSQALGVVTALREGVEGRFNTWLDKAISIDGTYNHAGPLIAKGRYFFELPWPKRNLKKSAAFLQEAVAVRPHALRAHYYLAETRLRDGDAKGAKAANDRALEGSDDYDPAEARRVKAWAKVLNTRIEEEIK